MNQWLNNPNPIQNGHASLGPTSDLPMSFPQQPQTINPAQVQNSPYLNGAPRTASPAFHQPMPYQTNQVIPSKRSREDSLGTSPRQSHNAPPGSRSQTPGQVPFPGFNAQSNGATAFTSAPTQFQHLQTSNNATPSPTMQQMAFSQAGVAARVSTASPNPFSPQHNMTGASPGPSERASRVGTPHDASQNFMQHPSSNQPFNPQQFPPGMISQINASQIQANQQQMQPGNMNTAAIYQRQLQQQISQMQGASTGNGITPGPQGQMAMPHPSQNQQGSMQGRMGSNNPQDFFRGLQQFSAAKGRPFDMKPVVAGRQIEAIRIYQAIMRGGGSSRVTKMNQWPLVAQALQFPQQQLSSAAMELQQYWLGQVGAFEQMWLTSQKKMHEEQRNRMQNQMSPTRDSQANNFTHQRAPSDMMNGKIPTMQQANGVTPTRDQNEQHTNHQRQSLSKQIDPAELNGIQSDSRPGSAQKRPTSAIKVEPEVESTLPVQKPIEDPFVPEVMPHSRYHGPINVDEMFYIGQQVVETKPVVPNLRDLGIIDIHALIMAIKSGLHGETRNALDTLITLSSEPTLQLQLDLCEDLMETLVDCAQNELDFLAENAAEVSDEVSLSAYEELIRSCHIESKTLQPIPAFGSLDYDLERAADRLICITTLIRNFSFYEPNFATLGQVEVVQLVTRVIQHIGTKDMPLRSSRNTLDFMKDIIIYLSNLSSSLHLPSKQDALCLLHFLLAFAPTPPPLTQNSERIAFAAYVPSIHKYLPPAVDSMAKLLARDEPNRVYFKAIFTADGRAAIPYELLTRAFGLAVAAIPSGTKPLSAQVDARKAFLLQGMLAAEILASLAPGSENPLARSWLQSEDCFAGNMLKVAAVISGQPSSLSSSRQSQHNRSMGQRGPDDDPLAHGSIVSRSMAVLRTLVNKSRSPDDEGNMSTTGVPGNVMLKKETLIGALVSKDIDPVMLRHCCQYASIEE